MASRSFIPMRIGATTWRASAVAAALLLAGAGSLAQGTTPPGNSSATPGASVGTTQPSIERADRRFLEHAAVGGMAEVELGQMAQQKASDPQVKAFGERMVQDHGKANDELKRIASDKGVSLPSTLDRSHKRDAQQLEKLSGAEFDRGYMKHMVEDHRKDVKDFEKAAKSARDPEVKSFAAQTVPTLKSHLQMAESTYTAVRANKSGDKNDKNDKSASAQGSAAGTATTATR